MPNLAIVIVNYNTRDLLAACLKSVYANRADLAFHVIVVDNGSTDGSSATVQEQFPQATLVQSDRNGGFGYANNLALRWLAGLASLPAEGTGAGSLHLAGPAPGRQPQAEVPEQVDALVRFPCDYVL